MAAFPRRGRADRDGGLPQPACQGGRKIHGQIGASNAIAVNGSQEAVTIGLAAPGTRA
jgi:hypothetical protein